MLGQDPGRADHGVPAVVRMEAGGLSRPAAGGRPELYNRKAPGAPADDLAKSPTALAEIMAAVARGGSSNFDTPEAMQLRNAMSERVPSQGGFMIPDVLRSDLLMAALEPSVVRKRGATSCRWTRCASRPRRSTTRATRARCSAG